MKLPLYSINAVGRHRRDMGDIDALAKSIEEIGLLHPVVVTREHVLVAGERRLAAARQLGWEEIDVTIVSGFTEARERLIAERDENTCRKDFTPSEAVALGESLKPLLRSEAKDRQRDGGKAAGRGRPKQVGETFAKLSGNRTPRTSDVLGEAVGMSSRTYEKAVAVIKAAEEDPEQYAPLVEEMDRTGKVKPAYDKIKMRSERSPIAVERNGGKKRPTFTPGTKKHAIVAKKNYERLGILFGQTQAIADGIEAINVDAAMTVLDPDDATAWVEDARRTTAALRNLSLRLRMEASRARSAATPGQAET